MGVPSLVALYLQADSMAGEKASGWVHGQVEMEMERVLWTTDRGEWSDSRRDVRAEK